MSEEPSRVQELRENVEEVRGIMQENFTKAEERELRLEGLDDRAEVLLKKSEQFQKSTRKVRERMDSESACVRCKNKKVIAIVVSVVVIIIFIIIIVVATQNQNKEN